MYCMTGNIGGLLNWQFAPKKNRCKKILAEFQFGGGAPGSFIKECCCLLFDHEVLVTKPQVHKFTKNKTGNVLAPRCTCTAHVEGCWMGSKSATACITSLCVACEIILADLI